LRASTYLSIKLIAVLTNANSLTLAGNIRSEKRVITLGIIRGVFKRQGSSLCKLIICHIRNRAPTELFDTTAALGITGGA